MRSASLPVVLRNIGANVSQLRAERGLTQDALAQRVGNVDVRYLVRIQRGLAHLSLDMLVALAEAFEVSPDRLLRPAEAPPAVPGRPPTRARRVAKGSR